MAQQKSLAEKLLALTDDRTQTTTMTPSFLDVIAPLLSILMFSGAGSGIEGLLGLGGKGGGGLEMLPSMGTAQKGMLGNFVASAPTASSLTPEMIVKMLAGGIGL